VLALIIAFLQMKFHIIKLAGASFLIDYFPVKLEITDFILVIFTALVIAFTAAWFPAKKASQQMFNLKA
jgi:lipoprotein-releasing system permease protein